MSDIKEAESPTTLFSKEFEDLHDDGFDGSMDEHRIFKEVFFKSENSTKKNILSTYDCSNSINSSLTNQDDYAKEDYVDEIPPQCVSGDLTSSVQNDHKMKSNYRLVESSIHGVTSSFYEFKNKLHTSDPYGEKEAVTRAVASPPSQESCAQKITPSAAKNPSKPKWKDHCFVKLDEEEFAMPKDIKNDPRPLLRYHINRLLRAAGWVIGRRKRNSKYNGIGEYVYKSPLGRPIREFPRAWCMCGQTLLTDEIDFFPEMSNCAQWSDMAELWTDLSCTFKEIDEKLSLLENNSSAMAHLWCLLDPFVKMVFIDKTIRSLKEGITVKAKRSLVISSSSSVSTLKKNKKIAGLEGSSPLFDVPISSENQPRLLEGSISSSPSFDNSEKQYKNGCKKSRKISEIGSHTGQRAKYTKKSKACGLNDDDLLISAIIKTKPLVGSTKKSSTRKSKGSCKLLPRNKSMGNKFSALSSSRTVLSWLIHSGVVSLNEVIQYRNLKNDDAVIKEGLITREGILCTCCHNVFSISGFKSHAGFRFNRPCLNLFVGSGGKPLTLCYLEAWSGEYRSRKMGPQTGRVNETDQNDDSCGHCGDVGELICCDNCPSAFHQACLFEQDLPEGSWYCPHCRCQICGDAVNDKETSESNGALKCSQCERKYHETCMQKQGMEIGLASDTWLCGESCHKVYSGLQSRIGSMNLLSDGLCWTLLQCTPGDQIVHSAQRVLALKAECNSKLAVAITVMEECFLPMVDVKTGIDMIPQVIYNWGSQFARLNYNGFYTVILEKDDVILSVASIRIHGVKIAELPLVATCSNNRRQGMCRRLITSIEEMLKSLKVEKLVVSAIPTLVETWTVGFGFQPLDEDERRTLGQINLMVFPGAVWLKKTLYENHDVNRESGSQVSTDEDGCPTIEHGQPSELNFPDHKDNFDRGICNGSLDNLNSNLSFEENDPIMSGQVMEIDVSLNRSSKDNEIECEQHPSVHNLSIEDNIETEMRFDDLSENSSGHAEPGEMDTERQKNFCVAWENNSLEQIEK